MVLFVRKISSISCSVLFAVTLLIGNVKISRQCQSEDVVADRQREVYAFEHGCIILRCRIPNLNQSVAISKAGTSFVRGLVKVTTDPRFHYNFSNDNSRSETIHDLKILDISADDNGTWSFIYDGFKSRSIKIVVYIRPSQDQPTCDTRNKFPVYIINDLMELTCSVQKSDPPVMLELDGPCDSKNSTFPTSAVSSPGGKRLGCTSVLTEVVNASHFICSFQQTYPSKWDLQPYHEFCLWGPLKIERQLTLYLNMLSESIIKGTSSVFECVCNVPDAIITWDFPPLSSIIYRSSTSGRSTVSLTLSSDFASDTLGLKCRATYRNQTVTKNFEGVVSTIDDTNCNASRRLLSSMCLFIALLLLVQLFNCSPNWLLSF